MQPAASGKENRCHHFAAEFARCLRDPLRPVFRLIFWLALLPEESRAVRWLAPFRWLMDLALIRTRSANLKLLGDALGWTAAQKTDVRRQHAQYHTRLDIHLMKLSRQTIPELLQSVQVQGEEHVAAALREGKGLLLLTAHTGTFFHVPLFLSARGHPVRIILNPGLPGRLGRYLTAVFGRFGARVSYVGTEAYGSAREAFRNGEIVLIAIDHSMRPDRSRWVPFGPVELPMDPGPAILALRQKVPVIWGRAWHDAAGRSHVEYSPPVPLTGEAMARATPESVLRCWSALFYEHWQQHPEQWWAISFCSLRPGANLKSSRTTDPL